MEVHEFIVQQESEQSREIFQIIHKLIEKHDSKVNAQVGSIMGSYQGITYEEDGVFKYGLNATKNHFSYHSMVMYAYPEILDAFKSVAPKIKFKKGCFNFKSLDDIPLEDFEHFLATASQQDFSPVIEQYKKKK